VTTGAASAIGPLGIGFIFEGGLTFDAAGRLIGVDQGDANTATTFEINTATGAAGPPVRGGCVPAQVQSHLAGPGRGGRGLDGAERLDLPQMLRRYGASARAALTTAS
jgi:hypothetical protein